MCVPRRSCCSAERKSDCVVVAWDEHPRATTLEALANLKPIVRGGGTVTAGKASGGLTPRARMAGAAAASVAPRVMGIGSVPATRRLLARQGLAMAEIELIELNEAFAAQALAVTRQMGLADDAAYVNPNGGAVALGHPLGMSGARLALTASLDLQRLGARYAIADDVHWGWAGNCDVAGACPMTVNAGRRRVEV